MYNSQAYLKKANTNQLKNKHVLIGISIGGKNHYGHRFSATIDLLKKGNPKQITFLVADDLQRHNHYCKKKIPHGQNNVKCETKAYNGGTTWLELIAVKQGLKNLRESNIDVHVLRWKDCVGAKYDEADYLKSKKEIEILYKNDNTFQRLADEWINAHIKSKYKENGTLFSTYTQYSFDYVSDSRSN